MKLSELVYLVVKNVIYFDDSSFTYDRFMSGEAVGDPDYSTNIVNALSPINEAIARLNDLDKIQYKVMEVDCLNHTIDLTNLEEDGREVFVKEIINVAKLYKGDYKRLDFRNVGSKEIVIIGAINCNQKVYLEFKEDIPMFLDCIQHDVELRLYGITASLTNYIIEYAQGKLLEPVAADLANMHITRAEQYFANIRDCTSAFKQHHIEIKDIVFEDF